MRQDGRRELRRRRSAGAPECRASHQTRASSGCSWSPTASASPASKSCGRRRAAARSPRRSSCWPPARSTRRRCCCALARAASPIDRDAVGRHFMNHNCFGGAGDRSAHVNDSVYQKTLGINDFYLDDGRGGPPLGNIQLLGRVTAPILKSSIRLAPEWALGLMSRRSVDWYAMSEDLPNPESRVTVDGGQIRLDWKRSNWSAHARLVEDFQGAPARGGLSDRALAAVRSPHAVASVRHRSHRARPGDVAARSLLPRLGPSRTCSSSTPRSCRRRRRSIRR